MLRQTVEFHPPSFNPAALPAVPRVLLVDHDPRMATELLYELARRGLDVTHAPDSVIAADALTTQAFDIVLSDVSLPGGNGVELLRLVRAYDLDVPVILMAETPTVETAVQAIELGALQYLPKPVNVETLHGAIKRGLSLGRLARARREVTTDVQDGSQRVGDRAGLTLAFERALESSRLVFQPLVASRRRNVVAYEVLLRTHDETLPDPRAMLGAAERLGAVKHLGQHLRYLASRAIAALPSPDILLFVNIHALELTDNELYAGDAPLSEHARRVVLELTERATLGEVRDLSACARRLRSLGYQIAVDDLGAGFAGLATFAALEPEYVKLDISITQQIERSLTKQRIARSVIDMCRDLSMKVVAEGVETRDQLACVTELGCDLLQGYYLGKPSDSPSVAVLL